MRRQLRSDVSHGEGAGRLQLEETKGARRGENEDTVVGDGAGWLAAGPSALMTDANRRGQAPGKGM